MNKNLKQALGNVKKCEFVERESEPRFVVAATAARALASAAPLAPPSAGSPL